MFHTIIEIIYYYDVVVVCGLQNYAEFFSFKYMDLIINYPIPLNETTLMKK